MKDSLNWYKDKSYGVLSAQRFNGGDPLWFGTDVEHGSGNIKADGTVSNVTLTGFCLRVNNYGK